MLRVAFIAVGLAAAAAYVSDGSTCPSNSSTACGPNSTCCPQMFSSSGYGCCHLGTNAVCCGLQGCCPAGFVCQNTPPWSSACVPASNPTGPTSPATQVCTPGAQFPTSHSSLPSQIVIGDSVSIGYTPVVTALLNETIFVQHSPWAGGGGADDSGNGLNCIEEFVRDSQYQLQDWSMVSFNFGLHNLNNATAAEILYGQQLVNITTRLQQTGAKLVYVLTTPYMPDRYFGNMVVEQLNTIATSIMQKAGIPIVDLYSRVIDKCGAVYKNCSICDNEYNNATGVYCGYHYTPAGWQWLGEFLAPVFQSVMGGQGVPPAAQPNPSFILPASITASGNITAIVAAAQARFSSASSETVATSSFGNANTRHSNSDGGAPGLPE